MQSDASLDISLKGIRRRVRLLLAERSALVGGAAAGAFSLILVVLDKFRLIRFDWPYLLALLALGILAGWVWGFSRKLQDFDVARATEKRLKLKERLSSAISLESQAAENDMIPALLNDAVRHMSNVQPARLFPRRLDRRGKVFIGLLVLLAAAFILPELPMFQSAATRKERAALRKQGEELVKLARKLEEREPPKEIKKLLQQIAANMKALGKDMERARVGRKEALVKLNKMQQQLEAAKQELTKERPQKSLAQAAVQLKAGSSELAKSREDMRAKLLAKLEASRQAGKGTGEGKKLSEAQMKALEKLAKSLENSPSQQMLNLDADIASVIAELLAKGDMQEALKILDKLAQEMQKSENLEKLSPEELKQMAEELRRLAESLKGTDLDKLAKELLEMAKAMERGDLKACKNSAGKAGLIGLGLNGKCAALMGLNAAQQGLGQCMSSGNGRGKGVGPGNGLAQYDPNAPSDINRGAATRIPAQHYDTRITGQVGDKGEAYSIQILGEPDKPGKAQVPYYKVYSDYSKIAENALDREEVPAQHRARVKDYFESLKPEQK